MSDPVFLAGAAGQAEAGSTVALTGAEGHHAAVVRRLRVGETIIVADGVGRAVRGPVTAVAKGRVEVRVDEVLHSPEPAVRWVVAQALAKGDHAGHALDMLTEIGAAEIVPWQAARCVVRWQGERAGKALARWRHGVAEATKQSRRFRVPQIADPVTTPELAERVRRAPLALLLHEEATTPLAAVELPAAGEVVVIVGPEGGVAPDEVELLCAAGARAVTISDGVLRTSTAGVAALAAAMNRPAR